MRLAEPGFVLDSPIANGLLAAAVRYLRNIRIYRGLILLQSCGLKYR
jgi:hypothetical protein